MLGVVHVQTTGRNQRGEVVLTFQRKVQVWKRDKDAMLHDGEAKPERIDVSLALPAHDPARRYGELAHLTNADSYLEDFTPGDVIEHSRGRVVTTDHIMLTGVLDNTSQVHCNQWMVSQDPERFVGGQLIVFGGIPFNLCLGISSADVGDNSLGDIRYATGRHTAPIFAGDTVFASTEIRGVGDFPGRPDLGVLAATLRGHKFVEKGDAIEKVEIFYLEREIAVKRRRAYTG
jgi:2-methylfumaryl-CoA hydratase